jgi:Mrp family chromosome partitioning ATPase
MSWRGWLDASPIAHLALALMRDATGRDEPLVPLMPVRAAALADRRCIAFWALNAGVGTSTVAALTAHRSASGGRPAVLVDLDRRAPTLGLRAGREGATVCDALLRPGGETALLSRWGDIRLLRGSPELARVFDGPRLNELLARLRASSAVVIDLGSGAEALDSDVLAGVDLLCVAVGSSVSGLQAAFCAAPLLEGIGCRIGAVIVGAAADDAARIAARLPWPLLASVPRDPFLAGDEFAVRAPTARALDPLIRSVA